MPTVSILTDQVIRDELRAYGVLATADVCSAIRTYISLLLHWNQKMSLTAITDPLEVLRFHFGESMFAAPFLFTNANGRLADVGSGAGFPGLPLKILIPTLQLILMESNAKKATFLAEVVRRLGTRGVEIYRGRFEHYAATCPKFNFIAARALGMHEELTEWAFSAIQAGGTIILWLGEHDSVKVASEGPWVWHNPIPVPGSLSRKLLVGTASEI